jgi:hypothetical protein
VKENKWVYRCALISAALLTVAAIARGLSINNIITAARTGDISGHFANSVLVGWILSVISLLLTATWLLFLSGDLKNLKKKAWYQAMIIGIVFAVFGGALWFKYPTSIHLPVFLLIGLTLVAPLSIYGRNFRD